MVQREMLTTPAPQANRRKRLTWLIAALALLLFVTLVATFLPRTGLLPATLRQPNPPPFLLARGRDARWRQDLNYLAREVPRLHVDAFHNISRDQFRLYVSDLHASIPTLTDTEVVLRLMALVALIGDGHTTLDYTPFYQGETPWRLYPLSLAWLEGDWYVVGTQPEQAHLLGAQLVAIDEVPVEGIFARLSAEVSADNDMQRRNSGATLLVTADVLASLGITEAAERAAFTFLLRDGQELESILEAVAPTTLQLRGLQTPSQELPLALRNPERWYWFETLPEQNALYFQYDVCAEMADLPFAEFTANLFAAVDEEGLSRIVLDLRFNSGGDSSILRPFLDGLAERPDVEVYVLIGRRTFSSALMNAIELDQQANGVLVGEATGGRPNHYGEVRSITLPNSQLRVSYSTKYFRMLPAADPPSLEPEIAAPVTIANQLAGHDAALSAALAE
jgi:hypothetical protein